MIRTLDLQGYRGFKSFRLPDLARVNLLVGKNNCGKTSILEAIEFLVSNGDPFVLDRSAHRRGELNFPDSAELSTPYGRETRPDVTHLFFGRRLEPGNGFHISSNEDAGAIFVELLSLADVEDELSGGDPSSGRQRSFFEDESASTSSFGLRIIGSVPGRIPILPLTEEGSLSLSKFIRSRRAWSRDVSGSRSVQFLSPESLYPHSMRDMWDRVLAEGRESEVIKAMKLLEADLESIHFLSGDASRRTSGGVLIGFQGGGRRLPLGSFGDGMRRLLALSLSLVRTGDGFLLIDEIDTGLHFSVMEEMWRLVVNTALESNVQVFATTHSYDCVHGLAALVESAPEIASQVSVQKIENSLAEAVGLDGKQMRVAARQDIEVR